MIKYTWYVNFVGDVQVYAGDINEELITDVYNAEDAMKDNSIKTEHRDIRWKRKGFFGKKYSYFPVVKTTFEYRETCKYWIPQEYAHAFFTCINEAPHQALCTYGRTNIEVSEWLD